MRQLVYISRKTNTGIGGMQQYDSDIRRVFDDAYGRNANCISIAGFSDAVIGSIRSAVASHRCSHVHLGDAALASLGRLIRWWNPSVRLSLTAHGLDVTYPNPVYQMLLRRNLCVFDRVVSVSRATTLELARRGMDAKRIVTIPCGIWKENHTAMLRSGPARNELLSVGRLVERKGIEWFIASVLPLVIEKVSSLHYSVIGDGPCRKQILALVRSLHLERHVTLLGPVSCDTRNALYRQASVFVMPNIPVANDMEGFGMVCIEAAACGLPVAAARLEGIQDAVVDGATGRFFEPGNSQDASRVISAMLTEPVSSNDVQRSAFERYDWGTLAKRYHDEIFAFA